MVVDGAPPPRRVGGSGVGQQPAREERGADEVVTGRGESAANAEQLERGGRRRGRVVVRARAREILGRAARALEREGQRRAGEEGAEAPRRSQRVQLADEPAPGAGDRRHARAIERQRRGSPRHEPLDREVQRFALAGRRWGEDRAGMQRGAIGPEPDERVIRGEVGRAGQSRQDPGRAARAGEGGVGDGADGRDGGGS